MSKWWFRGFLCTVPHKKNFSELMSFLCYKSTQSKLLKAKNNEWQKETEILERGRTYFSMLDIWK
jgi:hypothetical protein